MESNRGLDRIQLSERTLGDAFLAAGYSTGMVGKWHNGLFDMRHHPNSRGFQEFAGFLNGGMGYYDWILDYNGTARHADGRYLTDVFTDEAVAFIERHRRDPFLLYLAYNAPHSPLEAPADTVRRYQEAGGANPAVATLYAMVEEMDRGVGRLLDALENRGLAENTVVVFSSDNGPWLGNDRLGGQVHSMRRYNGPFRGMKQDVLEGGIRVPAIVRWPAGLPTGTECRHMVHFCDWLPTLVQAASGKSVGLPPDGVDQLPALRGGAQRAEPKRFWQFNRYDPVPHCNLAMRDGDWKLYWPRIPEAMVKLQSDNGPYRRLFHEPHTEMPIDNPPVERTLSPPGDPELYHLGPDPRESQDLAQQHPARLARMIREAENWFDQVEGERRAALATCDRTDS